MADKAQQKYDRSRVVLPLVAYPLSAGPLHGLSECGCLFWLPVWTKAVIQAVYLPLTWLCVTFPWFGSLVDGWLKLWT